MAALSNKSLPYLDKSLAELEEIDALQKEKFPFEQKFMSPGYYYDLIQRRKEYFKDKWESKSFLSWNLAEYWAYEEMFGGKKIIINAG